MNKSFAALKKGRTSDLEKLNQKLKDSQRSYSGGDDGYWTLSKDKTGTGYATIRFLPAPKGEEMPFVSWFSHAFQNDKTGMWYIEKSLTSIDKDDPVGEYNQELWNSGRESDKDLARKQKRKLNYVANILVIEDPANPDNNGKVFKFRFGKTLFNKINDAMIPAFPDQDPINVFDFWEGANFKLRVHQEDGWPKYSKSEFAQPAPLDDDDSKLEEIWNQEYSLEELVAPESFKTYAELKTRLNRVLGLSAATTAKSEEAPKAKEAKAPEPEQEDDEDDNEESFGESDDDDDDFPWDNDD